MTKFYIKHKVSLGFLGKEYKDAYLTFKTLPVSQYEDFFKKAENLTNLEATKVAMEVVKERFIEGKFITEDNELVDVTADDLSSFLDEGTLNYCYLSILGQKPDPKS